MISAYSGESGYSTKTYPFTMAWPVADAGYSWIQVDKVRWRYTEEEGERLRRAGGDPEEQARGVVARMKHPEGPYLVANAGSERRYNPLASDDFHRVFASTRPTELEILRFAAEYGDLGIGPEVDRPDGSVTNGTHFNDWRAAVSLLSDVIDLWDSVNSKNGKRIEQCFIRDHIPGRRAVKWKRVDHLVVVASEADPSQKALWNLWDKGPVAEAAWQWVRQLLAYGLRDHTVPIVQSNRREGFGIVPKTLIAAAYVSLGLEITGRRRRLRVCPVCGERFHPRRSDHQVCSPRCRQKQWREEQKLKTDSKSEDSEGSKESRDG